MRSKTSRMLLLILAITVFAVWVDLPGDMLDLNGFKADHPVREGLDLQGGLQVTLEARPLAAEVSTAAPFREPAIRWNDASTDLGYLNR